MSTSPLEQVPGAIPAVSYAYGHRSSLTDGTALTYDPDDRLSAFGSASTDRYDGDGHRVIKNTGGSNYNSPV